MQRSVMRRTRGEMTMSTTTESNAEEEEKKRENERRISKYAELLVETARTGMGQESVKILSLFKVHELKPSVEHYNAALAACREDHGLFTTVFKQMKEGEIQPNAVSHCIVNHVSEKKKDWSLAKSAAGKVAEWVKKKGSQNRMSVFRGMYDDVKTLGIAAPTLLMSGLIAELAHSGDWKQSLELLSEARENETKVSLAVVNIVAQSIEDAGLKTRAKELREDVSRDTVLCYDELHVHQDKEDTQEVDDPTMDYYYQMAKLELSPEEREKLWKNWENNPTLYFG